MGTSRRMFMGGASAVAALSGIGIARGQGNTTRA
jgi:hypothetical protein